MSLGSVPVLLAGWVQCVPSHVHLDLLALIAPRSARVVTEGYVTISAVSASAQLATLEKDARMNAQLALMGHSVLTSVTARTEPNATTSTAPAYVTKASRGLAVRIVSVPLACMDSSVTNTAPAYTQTHSAVTLCQESAPVLQDGLGFTVTRPAHQVTTVRAAESCVFVLMEPTVMASLELVSVHQDT